MIEFICLFYYIFSVLFMIGYVDDTTESIFVKLLIYFTVLIIAPIMFPFTIGYYIRKNS